MPEKCTDNPRDCPMLPRIEALEKANDRHAETHREIFDRLRMQETLAAVQDEKLDTIGEKLDDIAKKQKDTLEKVMALETKPAKRWESAVDKIICAIAGAVVMYVMAHLGLA